LKLFARGRAAVVVLAGIAVMAFSAVALAAVKNKTFSTGTISKAIRDQDVLQQKIQVRKHGKLRDLNVAVRADHTEIEDLTLLLESPQGKLVKLYTNAVAGDDVGSGSDSCGGAPTVFDDEAATSVETGTAPFAGSFRPEQALSSFNRQQIHGKWTLVISDGDGGDSGTLFCAKLRMRYKKTG
jgi:subtilisin-like proprotein convertase family protein